ncbi:MAG: DinB family protein [Gemmatimonadetes bacterium]|nr:DinB family protein [Gemmatimonadota bacterium]
MHVRTQRLLDELDTHRAALRAEVDRVPPALREQRPAPDRWSVAEVLEHLSMVENRIAGVLEGRIAAARAEGLREETETGPVVPENYVALVRDRSRPRVASEASTPRGLDAEGAWAALEQARGALRRAVLAGDGLALGEVTAPHPALGEIDLYQWIAFVGGHEVRHTDQLREVADALAAR